MLLEWMAREGLGLFVSWWALIAAAGAAAFPLCYRLLGGLPDRGYTVARMVGVLLTAFVFWLLASWGLLANTAGAMLLSWLIVLGLGGLAFMRMPERPNLRLYWRENRAVILCAEVLFAALLLGWMIFRAQYPDTGSTEKPMDLMFITSIMTSPTFPPNDGWMAGYSISYYYFGYVMAAMLSTLSGVSSTVGFSMTLASWFALTGLGAFGVAYNMARARRTGLDHVEQASPSRRPALATGLLAVFFVLIMSNWQFVFVELPWQAGQGNAAYYDFWATQARMGDPPRPATAEALAPDRWDNWWWFRASRVLNDFQLDGSLPPAWYAQPIDEFPAFSFLLGDSHPHVLALPFGMMALALALNVLLARRNPSLYELMFYAVAIGSMVFLNTWDVLAYVGAFVGAGAARRMMRSDTGRLSWEDIASLVGDMIVFVGVTVLAYGMFLYSFRSQAGGITLNLLYPTYFPHFILMFGTFALILLAYLLLEARRGGRRMAWGSGFGAAGLFVLVVLAVMIVGGVVLALRPDVQNLSRQFIDEAGGLQAALGDLLVRRITYLPVTLLMLAFIILIVARLFPRWGNYYDGQPTVTYSRSGAFALLLAGIGAVLVVTPEFIYLVDVFSSRINTIFKFYYQAWAVWGVASAFACYSLLAEAEAIRPPKWARGVMSVVLGVFIVGGSLYLVFGLYARAVVEPFTTGNGARFYGAVGAGTLVQAGQRVRVGDVLAQSADSAAVISQQDGVVVVRDNGLFVRSDWTVDGARFMVTSDDYQTLQCLKAQALPGEIAVEAIGQAYNPQYGRVAGIAGVPVLLGWENHQRQWRGPTYGEIVGTRPQDIVRLYTDPRWDVAAEIIARYGIDYVMYGSTEIRQYGLDGREKFIDALPLACISGESIIFRVPPRLQLR